MSNGRRPPARQSTRQREQSAVLEDVVPGIPMWIMNWGFMVVVVGAFMALAVAGQIGHVYGAGFGWATVITEAAVVAALWWQDYSRRAEAARARADQELYELHEIAKVDRMRWDQFEAYCADLLRALGYCDVRVIGSTPEDDGADIVATDPHGIRVAVQCKRRAGSIGPDVIRELIGTTTDGRHEGRAGIVMSNAPVTAEARARAGRSGILLVDRPVLQQWMSQARGQTGRRGDMPGALGAGRSHGMRPAAKITVACLAAAVVLGIVIGFQHPIPRSLAKTATSARRTEVAGPSMVVREALAAINGHHWGTLWRLWPHPEHDHGQSYRKMIAGYRFTARDVMTSLTTHGPYVSARVLAYETTGTVQTLNSVTRFMAGRSSGVVQSCWEPAILARNSVQACPAAELTELGVKIWHLAVIVRDAERHTRKPARYVLSPLRGSSSSWCSWACQSARISFQSRRIWSS